MDRARDVLARLRQTSAVRSGQPPRDRHLAVLAGRRRPGHRSRSAAPRGPRRHDLRGRPAGRAGRADGLDRLDIPGVTDGSDNDYAAQTKGALAALADHDLVVIHVESPDEEGHAGDAAGKIAAIEDIDREVMSRVREATPGQMRVLACPTTPRRSCARRTSASPCPFLLPADAWRPTARRATTRRLPRRRTRGRSRPMRDGPAPRLKPGRFGAEHLACGSLPVRGATRERLRIRRFGVSPSRASASSRPRASARSRV